MNESCHLWMRHVTYDQVVSQISKSCHVWMSLNESGYTLHTTPTGDDGGKLLEGIRIEDMGIKTVANDLDNARVWFHKVSLVCTHIYMWPYVCLYVCVYVYMYVCMYACMHVCMYICMCMYVRRYVFVGLNLHQNCSQWLGPGQHLRQVP